MIELTHNNSTIYISPEQIIAVKPIVNGMTSIVTTGKEPNAVFIVKESINEVITMINRLK